MRNPTWIYFPVDVLYYVYNNGCWWRWEFCGCSDEWATGFCGPEESFTLVSVTIWWFSFELKWWQETIGFLSSSLRRSGQLFSLGFLQKSTSLWCSGLVRTRWSGEFFWGYVENIEMLSLPTDQIWNENRVSDLLLRMKSYLEMRLNNICIILTTIMLKTWKIFAKYIWQVKLSI